MADEEGKTVPGGNRRMTPGENIFLCIALFSFQQTYLIL